VIVDERRVKEPLRNLIQLSIQRPQEYAYGVLRGNRIPGVLLYGPPGTGKTFLAKAVATEAKCITLEVSGAQVLQRYVGESEKIIQTVFELAKALQPCVVFLDEADSVFTKRTEKVNSWERTMVNQFLHEWDNMGTGKDNAFIIVATNRPQDIDDAILRRLPQRIHVGLPSAEERLKILEHYLADERHPDVNLANVANRTQRYSGSDLKNLCIEAATKAVADDIQKPSTTEPGAPRPRRLLAPEHFIQALQEIRPCTTEHMLAEIRQFQLRYGDDPWTHVGTVKRITYRIKSGAKRMLRR
jgi:SpoVK/Ycf46/Vps4 family AAA+-type ATPase